MFRSLLSHIYIREFLVQDVLYLHHAELQRCESCENIPLELSRLSVDSIIISVAFISDDPSYPVLPSFVGLRMLMAPSKTQHRI